MKPIIKMQKNHIKKQQGLKFKPLNASYEERKKWYLSDKWKQLRESFLAEHPYCARCGEHGKSELATIVDHVEGHEPETWKEKFFTGPFQALCWSCHSRKTASEEMKTKKVRMSEKERFKILRNLRSKC